LSAHVNLCYFVFACVSRSLDVLLNICSKLVRSTFIIILHRFA
jgi:hypothetical protein